MADIILVDDHPVTRMAIRLLLEKQGHVIVAEAEDGLQGLKLIIEHQPNMVLVDLDLPSISGIDLIEKLRAKDYQGGILVLTGRNDEHYLSRCMSIGADGFVGKNNGLDEMGDAVRAVARGYGYFPIKRKNASSASTPSSEVSAIQSLSNRELQVLKHLARGIKISNIAKIMSLSNKTVSTYKARVLAKLELTTTLELVDFSRRHHLD